MPETETNGRAGRNDDQGRRAQTMRGGGNHGFRRHSLVPTAMLWVALLTSCAAVDRRADEVVIDEVELRGVGRFEKKRLLAHTHATEHSIWFWGDDGRYSQALARLDQGLVRDLYHAYGYHQVEVEPVMIEARNSEEARVVVTVREGAVTRISVVRYDWLGLRPEDAPAVERRGPRVGDPFEVEAFVDAAQVIRGALQDLGHMLATVEKRAEVDRRRRTAVLSYAITAGPVCRVGAVRFEGLREVAAEKLYVELAFSAGEALTPALLRRMEKVVYAVDMFRTVSAVPAAAAAPDGSLDVVVHLDELRPQSLEVGGGVVFEPTRWAQRVRLRYGHDNLLQRLLRFDVRLELGYAELPALWQPDEHGPIFVLAPRLRYKGLFEDHLMWSLAPVFELGIEQGYQFYTPSGRAGTSRFFWGRVLGEVSYQVSFFDFFNVARALDEGSTELGFDFRDPYLLSFVETTWKVFLTDDLFMPRRGVVLEAAYALAGGALGGDFDFHRIKPTARGYLPLTGSTLLAAELSTGIVVTYGSRPGAPFAMKYALGGADSVRGWGLRRLSPQVGDIPVGGFTMVQGSVELRQRIIGDLSLALFGDLGDVQAEALTWRPAMWQYASGVGARYTSAVGVFRLDVGIRINEDRKRFPNEPRWAVHLALGEPF